MTNLYSLLDKLALEPRAQLLFQNDPVAFVETMAIPEAWLEVFKSGDRAAVSRMLSREVSQDAIQAASSGSFVYDNGPDPMPDPEPIPEPFDVPSLVPRDFDPGAHAVS